MKYIRIKDWEKHQHYKDRNPPWIKLQNALLIDYEFSTLSDASKLQLILLWLLASQMENKIPADEAWIKNNIKTTGKIDLKPLETLGFIELYQDASGCVQSACLETEGETEKEERHSRVFVKPTADEAKAYAKSKGFVLDGNKFVDFYASKGWLVGKSPMKDWKACVRTWNKNDGGTKASTAEVRT